MKWRAVRADAGYILRHWSRSGQAVVISIIVPLILLGAFGLLFQGGAAEPPVLHVHDPLDTNETRAVIARLHADGLVTVRPGDEPPVDIVPWMQAGGLAGSLVFGTVTHTEDEGRSELQYHLVVPEDDAHDGRVLIAAVERALDPDEDAEDPTGLVVDTVPVGPEPRYLTFLLPGILGLSIALSGIAAGFSSMTELRHMGLLQRLQASPLRKSEWLLGRMLGSVAIGFVAATVLVGVAWLLEPGGFRVGLWTALLVVGGTLVFAGLGTLLGLVVARPEVGTAILNLALLPLVLLSGTFFSLDQIPAAIRWLSVVSPLTHLTAGLRSDMLHGTGPASDATGSVLIVFAMALIVLVIGSRLIRWTERD
jgi:ABC transporter DrrB family efflux protein